MSKSKADASADQRTRNDIYWAELGDEVTGAREASFGLSTVQSSPAPAAVVRNRIREQLKALPRVHGASAIIPRNGGIITIKAPSLIDPPRIGGKRGVVTGFSHASRRRLMRLCMSIDLEAAGGLPIFVTLTYPKEYPDDNETTKGHLDSFCKRLYRQYPGVSGIWRIERQQRGAPHYHLLLFGVRYIPHAWVSEAWFDIVGNGDAQHLAAGTRVEAIRTFAGVVSYAAKYISKEAQEAGKDWQGRQWGVHNRACLPVNIEVFALTDEQFVKARRIVRKYLLSKGVRLRDRTIWSGATCFIPAKLAKAIVACVSGPANEIDS